MLRAASAGVVFLIAATVACDTTPTVDHSTVVPYERRPLPDPEADFDEWPSIAPEQEILRATFVRVPKAVRLGEDLRYVIALHNASDEDVSLNPCPAYYSAWGESATAYFAFGYLNCPDAPPEIPADGTVRFEMVLDMPHDLDGLDRFPGTIIWRLQGSDGETESAFSDTVVVGASEFSPEPS